MFSRVLIASTGFWSVLFLVACAEHSGEDSGVCDNDPLRRAAFEDRVVPALSKCARCHGRGQAPEFLSEDPEMGYLAAKPLLVSLPSRFEIRAGNGHCGPDCMDNAAVVAAMTAFRTAVGGACEATGDTGEHPYRSTTATVSIPRLRQGTNLPQVSVDLTFPADPAINPRPIHGLAEVTLRLSITRLFDGNNPTENCVLTGIQHRTARGNVRFSGLSLWPNAIRDGSLKNYRNVPGRARTTGTAFQPLYRISQELACPQSISVSAGARDVETFPPEGCNPTAQQAAQANFVTNVYPLLIQTDRCRSCHRANNGNATQAWSTTRTVNDVETLRTGAELHTEIRSNGRVNFQSATQSAIYRAPIVVGYPHSGGKTRLVAGNPNPIPHFNAAETALLLAWLTMEVEACQGVFDGDPP